MQFLKVLAPAKLNLGLQVIGRRPDGFHEIRTVMVTVSIFDRLAIAEGEDLSFHADDPRVSGAGNLVVAAATRLAAEAGTPPNARIELAKRIPIAAGLGGASSDAAATLVALNRLWGSPLSAERLSGLAAAVGSDVPFLLRGGAALVGGRGERIVPLRAAATIYVVVAAPRVVIPAKTATLYDRLRAADFGDGRVVESLAAGGLSDLTEAALANAFARPLYDLLPALPGLVNALRSAGAEVVALSGAGPAHYAPTGDLELAHDIARRLRRQVRSAADVFVCRTVAHGPIVTTRPSAQFSAGYPDAETSNGSRLAF